MNEDRRNQAQSIRVEAANLAASRYHPEHVSNGDEEKYTLAHHLASFTKGLPHDYTTGLIANPDNFAQLVKGINSSEASDFRATPLGPPDYVYGSRNNGAWKSLPKNKNPSLRAWESQAAGNLFDLEGPDAQSVTMPPAPKLGSAELTAEMAEVYAQALLRDVPFTDITKGVNTTITNESGAKKNVAVKDILDELNSMAWFDATKNNGRDICENGQEQSLSENEQSRVRTDLTSKTSFRGITQGDDIGPYISQFLLAGDQGVGKVAERKVDDGFISYGATRIDQRVRYAVPCKDYMTTWNEWYDVQHAADLGGTEEYSKKTLTRFITTPRDLATYVHYDALYQAYLNACLLLLNNKYPLDPGIPFQDANHLDHQQGFAHFGGPHILSLVTEVATRALKAVRFQKFNIHRRMRPEVLAARLSKQASKDINFPELDIMLEKLKPILDRVDALNGMDVRLPKGNYLLPMAFPEGSPMHPSYGAGHATVAGACVTILKAFFDHSQPINFAGAGKAFVPLTDGSKLRPVPVRNGKLTVEGELNKLASNIAIGRDWAGVHYFTDYIESLRMGEHIAIGILEEQKLTYNEDFSMTIPLFDGGTIQI